MTYTATTHRVLTHHRRRRRVSLSAPALTTEPVGHLDHATEMIHRTTRSLAAIVPDHDELIALAGLLTQISGALLTLTELLTTSTHQGDRTPTGEDSTDATRTPTAADLLRDCRNSYLTAHATARAAHAHLKHPETSGNDHHPER